MRQLRSYFPIVSIPVTTGFKLLPIYKMDTNYTTDCIKNVMNGKQPENSLCHNRLTLNFSSPA